MDETIYRNKPQFYLSFKFKKFPQVFKKNKKAKDFLEIKHFFLINLQQRMKRRN